MFFNVVSFNSFEKREKAKKRTKIKGEDLKRKGKKKK